MIPLLILSLVAAPETPMSCATPLLQQYFPVEPLPLPAAKKPFDPPAPGDQRQLWVWDMTVMPPAQYLADFTCQGTGEHCYVMIHDSVWNAGLVDSADVARIVERFDHSSPRDSTQGVWDHNTSVLGMPPDAIDQDSSIYLIYYNIGTFHGTAFDGFWMYFDEYYDTTSIRRWGYHSNEVECVYLDCYPNNPSEDYRIAIAAHEFGHMIHWNYDQSESLWVQEGCCELAMWLFGSPDPISGFTSAPDNDLTKWTGSWSDYIKTYLWFLYLYEQYGGRVGNDLIHNIIAAPEKSIAGIDAGFAATGLPQTFEPVFDDWVLANRINDTAFLSGRYGYFGENVPRFAVSGFHTTYPVSRNAALSRWAGEYVLFQQGTNLELEFDGADLGNFHLYVVGLDTIGHRLLLDSVPLDSLQRGGCAVPGFDTAYQSVYLVPTNHHQFETQTYSYSAQASGIQEGPRAAGPRLRYPSVVSSVIALAGNEPGKLLDVTGRKVARLVPGRNDVSNLPAGVYYLRTRSCPNPGRLVLLD